MATRTEHGDAAIFNAPIRRKRKEGIMRCGVVADNFPLNADMPPIVILGAATAIDVLMPASAADNDGLIMTIMSSSSATTGVITLKTSTDAALSPAVTVAQNLGVEMLYIHGTGWRKKGGG